MSRFRQALKSMSQDTTARTGETVVNFMGGESYVINALDTLKMVTASSIFGEPSYYRQGGVGRRKIQETRYAGSKLLNGYLIGPRRWSVP